MIHLSNPSFEDSPRPAKTPSGWSDCGVFDFPMETPPDIFPQVEPMFGVTIQPMHGQTYLGMVTRKNESWESIAQKLSNPLRKDSCYAMSFYLCQSPTFKSHTRFSQRTVDFTTPIKLRIWGGNDYCDKGELLAESPLVKNAKWQNYYFNFQPKKEHEYIILEAFFQIPTITAPNGNIMIDHGSPIILISCEEEKRKEQLTKFEGTRNDLELRISKDTYSRNPAKIDLSNYEKKALESQIKEFGAKIKFKNNRITLQGEMALRRILGGLFESPNQKLIIDFGGLKEKRFEIRKKSVEEVLRNWREPFSNLEIINSKEENKEVKWILEKDHLYIGIIKNE